MTGFGSDEVFKVKFGLSHRIVKIGVAPHLIRNGTRTLPAGGVFEVKFELSHRVVKIGVAPHLI